MSFVGGLHCFGPLNDDVCSWLAKDDITVQEVTGGVRQGGGGGCNFGEAQKCKVGQEKGCFVNCVIRMGVTGLNQLGKCGNSEDSFA